MGFSRQGYWSGLPFPPPGDLPDPGIEPASPALAGRFFTTEPPGTPPSLIPHEQLGPNSISASAPGAARTRRPFPQQAVTPLGGLGPGLAPPPQPRAESLARRRCRAAARGEEDPLSVCFRVHSSSAVHRAPALLCCGGPGGSARQTRAVLPSLSLRTQTEQPRN